MDELIERLNEAWRKLYGDGDEHDVCDTLAEAAAALETAREDSERYRWLRARWGRTEETYDNDRLIFIGDARQGEGWDTNPESLDAAIDAAIDRTRRSGK